MSYLLELIIFLIVLFLYIHINYHTSTSNDPEVYEYNDTSKDQLEDICNLKQPVIINRNILDINLNKLPLNEMYKEYDLSIRDVHEEEMEKIIYLPLNYSKATTLFEKDTNSQYYSEKNENFIKDTGLIKIFQNKDKFFRPPLTSNSFYDILLGSNSSCTPLRYDINYRNYIYVSSGSCNIKLIAPDKKDSLYPIMDYVNFEFRSSINPWNVQEEFMSEFKRIKTIDITLSEGQTLFIPAYWFSSIKFNTNTRLINLRYRNYFNIVSILPYLGMHYLQIQNIKKEQYKKLSFAEEEKAIEPEPEPESEPVPEPIGVTESQNVEMDIIDIKMV
jgi:hypothetical protein